AGALIEFADQPKALEAADPVLAGDGPAEVEPELHDLGEGLLRLGHTGRIGGVEEHARMHVPVPGVPGRGDLHLVLRLDDRQPGEELAEAGPRNAHIVDELSPADASHVPLHRRRYGPSGGDEHLGVRRIIGEEHLGGALDLGDGWNDSSSATAESPAASDWTSRSAPASSGRPKSPKALIIATVAPSMSSSIEGAAPEAMYAETVCPADSISGKIPTPVTGGASFGLSARVISTMTPRVPSEPTNSAA